MKNMKNSVNIVLFHPEIPPNTANVIRTCVGCDVTLHLIKPYGFELDLNHKIFKRDSANYAHLVKIKEYDNWEAFVTLNPLTSNYCFITRYGLDTYNHIDAPQLIKQGDIYLIFGSESSGIDKDILLKYKYQTYRLPTSKNVRSLNLGNCVMSVLYDVLRQLDFCDLLTKEPHKLDYLQEDNNV